MTQLRHHHTTTIESSGYESGAATAWRAAKPEKSNIFGGAIHRQA